MEFLRNLFRRRPVAPGCVVNAEPAPGESSMQPMDIASAEVAGEVHRVIHVQFYMTLLDAVQEEARKVGFDFYRSGSGVASDGREWLPASLEENLARALAERRRAELFPRQPAEDRERGVRLDMSDGYAHAYVRQVIAALAAQGIRLQRQDVPALAVRRGGILLKNPLPEVDSRQFDAAGEKVASLGALVAHLDRFGGDPGQFDPDATIAVMPPTGRMDG